MTNSFLTDEIINDIENDIYDIENNIEYIDILIVIVNINNEIEKCIKKKKQVLENILSKDDIKNIIKKIKSLDNDKYNILYLLNFSIYNDYETISSITKENESDLNFSLTSITNIDDIKINNNLNSLIIILKEKDKIYYVSKKKYKNKTKKRF